VPEPVFFGEDDLPGAVGAGVGHRPDGADHVPPERHQKEDRPAQQPQERDEEENPDPNPEMVIPDIEDPVDETGVTEEDEDRRRPPMIDIRTRPKTNSLSAPASAMRKPQGGSQREARPAAMTRANPTRTGGHSSAILGVLVPSISSSVSTGNTGALRLGDQTVTNADGYLDDELMKTVQQIIAKYDKN